MSDRFFTTPLFISTWSGRCGPGHLMNVYSASSLVLTISLTWPVANQATYMPMTIPFDYPMKRVWWVNGSSVTSTNVDFGIYTFDGVKIYSTGSTARAGASLPQYVAADFLIPAGRYYFGHSCSSITASRGGAGATSSVTLPVMALSGLLQEASALALPAAMTPVTPANAIYPLCGITRTASGF